MTRQRLFQIWMIGSFWWVACWVVFFFDGTTCGYDRFDHEVICQFSGDYFSRSLPVILVVAWIVGIPLLALLYVRQRLRDDANLPSS